MLSWSSAVSGNACLHLRLVSLNRRWGIRRLDTTCQIKNNYFLGLLTHQVLLFRRSKARSAHWWITTTSRPKTKHGQNVISIQTYLKNLQPRNCHCLFLLCHQLEPCASAHQRVYRLLEPWNSCCWLDYRFGVFAVSQESPIRWGLVFESNHLQYHRWHLLWQ